jgi:hypothetical protein
MPEQDPTERPFEKYRAEVEKVDLDRWPEMFSAKTRAAVETEAEEAAHAAYSAVRRAAENADREGRAQERAEEVHYAIQHAIAETLRAEEGHEE